jgi:hypothetical protein
MKLKTLLLIPLIASVISFGSGGSKIKPVQQDAEKRMVKIMNVAQLKEKTLAALKQILIT